MVLTLQSPCDGLKGVGEALAKRLAKMGLHTLHDVLWHLPFRYQDRTQVTPLARLSSGETVMIEAVVQSVNVVRGKRLMLTVQLQDASGGSLRLKFFHFKPWLQQKFVDGSLWHCFGEVKLGPQGWEMLHPECQAGAVAQGQSQHLTPIYPSTLGITQRHWWHLTEQALTVLNHTVVPEVLPLDVCQSRHFPDFRTAVMDLHRPAATETFDSPRLQKARQRLAFEELLAQQLSLKRLRQQVQTHQACAFPENPSLRQQFLQQLAFQLTPAQERVIQDIYHDLAKTYPMLRLVQGDVGSGKTVVAAVAALPVLAQACQVAVMAPTELLAEQHYANFQRWFAPLGFKVGLLLGKHSAKSQRDICQQLALGQIDVIIGTHSLFQQQVQFAKLALVIIDEQHRFGVQQRLQLRNKGLSDGRCPHQLIMTATPIPRTLAMTAYADLDHSRIDQLPPGRLPVQTLVVANQRRAEIVQRIDHLAALGQQVYWVCPLIEESEVLQCQAAETVYQQLQQALPQRRFALLHGRVKATQKEQVMHAFQQRQYDVLVATTVIEVGVDIPNATLMVIENAERLGLAQLHQLRGRVGRGGSASFCVLLYQAPLSKLAQARLTVMKQSTDGFVIAEQDLLLRGPGEVLGTRQTGLLTWQVADMERDAALLPEVEALAHRCLSQQLKMDELLQRWLPDQSHYSQV